jgi:hypothetical protein
MLLATCEDLLKHENKDEECIEHFKFDETKWYLNCMKNTFDS